VLNVLKRFKLTKSSNSSKYRVFLKYVCLTSEITRQFMKLFSITFCKIRKSIPRFFAPQFLPNESFYPINYSIFCNHENLNFDYLFFAVTMEVFNKALFLSQQKIFALTHRRVYTLMVNLFQILTICIAFS
jgi:hypothetical protein